MKYITSSILRTKQRRKDVHKGFFGKTLLVGGNESLVGAPAMAAMAAESILRSGSDLVAVAAPAKTAWAVNCISPDTITYKLNGKHLTTGHYARIMKLAEDFDAVLIGPGMGRQRSTLALARKLAKSIDKPKVIDADALKAVRIQEVSNAILTPHQKEFEIMLRNSRIKKDDMDGLRKKMGSNVILLKGTVDRIISKQKVVYNKTGNSVMTKAGTGDVLAGLCAGFAAQGIDLFRSACMGAYLNGKVGDYLLKKKGRTFIASDLVKNIDKVYR
ncbi:NAD(P)H-hydrate dehydratase [Candidatus Woesearchaeota archaeon]|nr:NAD(P)H-hydrate dehydratase [Candidatus Woesearchaeota archaeon]